MIALSVLKAGCTEAIGTPDVFLSEQDFERVQRDDNTREDLINAFGEGVTIGRLGNESPSGRFREEQDDVCLPEDEEKGVYSGFYEKLY